MSIFSEGIHKIKCKCGHDDEKCETCGIKYKYSNCWNTNYIDDLCCNEYYPKKFDKKLK